MEKNPLRFFRIQKTDRYLRIKIGILNIYFSLHPLSTRKKNSDTGGGKVKRKKLKRRLLDEIGFCQHCGKPLTWDIASVHHIVPKSVDPSREFDFSNLQLLCTECHTRIHQIEQLKAKNAYDAEADPHRSL